MALMVEPRMLISRESLMTSSVWELAALMQHREWEGGSERENGRLRVTDRKGAITASLLKKTTVMDLLSCPRMYYKPQC